MYKVMMLIAVLPLMVGLAAPSAIQAGVLTQRETLRFVAHTAIPPTDSATSISLCHSIDQTALLGLPVYTQTKGYALAEYKCAAGTAQDLSAQHLADLQAAGFVSASLPSEAKANLVQFFWGHAVLVLMGLLLFARSIINIIRHERRTKPASPDALALHSLVAMSQVAVADGSLETPKKQQISQILTRLTGQFYTVEHVSDLLDRLAPSADDLADVGLNLSDKDRQIVLEAALNVAVSDGHIQPKEYEIVTYLAERMRIGAEPFRSALRRIAGHLHTGSVI